MSSYLSILSLILYNTKKVIVNFLDKAKKVANPKDTIGLVWLYMFGAVAWLITLGTAAMNMRTYLVYSQNSPAVGPIYYTMLTIHGWSAMLGLVPDAALGIIIFSMYKSGLSVVHRRLVTSMFWISNLGLVFALFGGPDMGWYMYPPLAIEDNSLFQAFRIYHGAMMGAGYLALAFNSACGAIAALTLVIDAYLTKPKDKKINIFAAYGVAFSLVIAITLPALTASELWYTMAIWLPSIVKVNPLLWVILFWFYGHPVVYYVPFPLFGALYYYIPIYAKRSLFSEKWARWNIFLLAIGSMLIWVHHLQTFPLPVDLRAWITVSTLILASGSGLTVLNLGLTILTSNGYNYKDPLGLTFLVALIGFIIGGVQALPLPINIINGVIHNTYYVVGHFHLIIWTLILVGFTGVFIDLLKVTNPNLNFSAKATKLMLAGIIWWTIPFVTVGYLMSAAGYLGLLRRVIAYPPMFVPYMELMSFLAEIGIPGLVVTISTAIAEYVRTSTPSGISLSVPSMPGTMSYVKEIKVYNKNNNDLLNNINKQEIDLNGLKNIIRKDILGGS
ncbi:proton pump complex quinol oxidase subunit SoxB [Acidianus manzaensis]|uniref:Cytochrome B6 n=1 Tax=Acidianus manzaensis TaxID=282676 RepID=A0A1W6JX37_9CREN|nr:proton pump complex quinol oxidase subunit SoxB [Acidianus manzaensis]ARM74792.1 cytochrome B6 [Acidianus manzaensis]